MWRGLQERKKTSITQSRIIREKDYVNGMANGGRKKDSVQNAVYKALKEGILTLRLVPGTPMSTQEMATRLNVSRTPVREAFIWLQEEGLVEILPQRETLVSQIDMERVREERFIRESLELAMLSPFMKLYSREQHFPLFQEMIQQQKKCLENNLYSDFVKSDNRMHKLFFVVARKSLAWETLQSVNGHDIRFRILISQNPGVMEASIRQHEKLLDLIEARDEEGLYQEMKQHLRKWTKEKEELMVSHPGYFRTEEEGGDILKLPVL